jgi:hypothetical protein
MITPLVSSKLFLFYKYKKVPTTVEYNEALEKTKGAMTIEQSRDTDNISHKTETQATLATRQRTKTNLKIPQHRKLKRLATRTSPKK